MINLTNRCFLGACMFLVVTLAAFADEYGNKKEFINYCTVKQSLEFCQCALDEKFDSVYQNEVRRRKMVMEQSQENVARALKRTLNSDPTLDEHKIKQYCPIKRAFQLDIEAYAMEKFGSKRILRRTTEVKADIESIRMQHAVKMDFLHEKFNTNELTRQHFNNMKIPYCTSLVQAQIDKESYERAGDPTFENPAQVSFKTVLGQVIKNHRSSCRALFKR